MKLFQSIPWFICLLFFLACARQTAPTGGPKDTIPPILVSALPQQGQTNYAKKNIELTFDEMLLLNNPKEQIIIIPDIGKDYEITTKKNRLLITLEKDLIENTTYSLNFRDAIQDITEKNPTKNLKLAFSTGNYIDSLSISGTVYNLLKSTEIEDATVALYQTDTFDIFNHKPSYFSKTDKKGAFIIDNLKPGTYYLYAIDDRNKNLIVESKSEAYGFLPGPIHLSDDTSGISVHVNRNDTRPLKLTSARPSGTYYNIKANKSISTYSVSADRPLTTAFGEDQENIRIYNTFPDQDSLAIHFIATDSINQQIDTTLYAKFNERTLSKESFTITPEDFRVIGPKGIITGKLTFNKPLLAINYDSIFFQIDSANTIPITEEALKIDTIHNKLIIQQQFDRTLLNAALTTTPQNTDRPKAPNLKATTMTKPTTNKTNDNNQIIIARTSFISVENDSSNAVRQTIKPTTPETTGIIVVKINTQEPHYITQLLAKDYTVLASSIDTPNTSFEDLEPTTYQIRLIIDSDGNGQWTPGNFYNQQPAEPAIFYRTEKKETIVPLKANWEIGPLLITY